MAAMKIAVSMDSKLVAKLDRMVRKKVFASRSQAVRSAVREKIQRTERARLARECAKLEPRVERALAEEGLPEELAEWPEY